MIVDPNDCFHVVHASGANGPLLDVLCFERQTGLRSIYLHVMDLQLDELDLNAGRFVRFSKYHQSCRVVLEDQQLDYYERMAHANRIVDWIAQNTKNRWSFRVECENINRSWIEWSFADSSEAIMFKLVWC